MLQVEQLTCGYGGAPVVQNVSFAVRAHEKLCVLGANGCGKTTLLRAISGMLPSEGRVTACGVDVLRARRPEVAKILTMMSQISSAYFSYTVHETVMLGRYAHQKRGVFAGASAQDTAAVEEALACTGLCALRDTPITELSGGQLQRVFLARTFAQSPRVILLDEPTNHLDLKYQLELTAYLTQWAAQGERCVVGVLHDVNLALTFADSVLLMQAGRVAAHCAAQDIDFALLADTYGVDVRAYMQQSLKRWE